MRRFFSTDRRRYLFGGVVAGKVVSSPSQTLGWQRVVRMLAGVALLTGLVAAFFLANQLRPAAPAAAAPLGAGSQGCGAPSEDEGTAR